LNDVLNDYVTKLWVINDLIEVDVDHPMMDAIMKVDVVVMNEENN
jgi:hypothetical protein